jgi:protease-4
MIKDDRIRGIVLLPLIIITGIFIGYLFFSYTLGTPKVGVIKFEGILDSEVADQINEMLRYAEERRDIKAVVLEVNSPGGFAVPSEDVYLNVLRVRGKKPFITSINDLGASGAYFIASASDYIISKPTSNVGSIGVRADFPEGGFPDEITITTGPLKRTGSVRNDFIRDLEIAKQSFLRSVLSQRGDKITLDENEISKAGIYIGVEAKRFGLVDELGSNTDAYEKAASLAGLRTYEILYINEKLNISTSFSHPFLVNMSTITRTNTVPIYNFIYLAPGER